MNVLLGESRDCDKLIISPAKKLLKAEGGRTSGQEEGQADRRHHDFCERQPRRSTIGWPMHMEKEDVRMEDLGDDGVPVTGAKMKKR